MPKLIILPGSTDVLGGTLVTLSLLLKGIEKSGFAERVKVLSRSNSFMEKYLKSHGLGNYLEPIKGDTDAEFVREALQWVEKQPQNNPLLMDNCVAKQLMSVLVPGAVKLRLRKRPIYFFFHDLALSHNPLGYGVRKFIFSTLAPATMCNSQFTAGHIKRFVQDIRGILYQPVDFEKFNDFPLSSSPPKELQGILDGGTKIMLTPSRLNKPKSVNDKNLRALIPVLRELKRMGHFYHGVIVGDDNSSDGSYSRDLREAAEKAGVADCFTILSPTFNITEYYKCADIVVTLAPREPFGRTVVEAIACGIPVVGSCTGGIREILSNFAPEWTVNPEDPVTVAQTIIKVTEDSNTLRLLSQGQAWVQRECSLTNYAHRILEITGINSL